VAPLTRWSAWRVATRPSLIFNYSRAKPVPTEIINYINGLAIRSNCRFGNRLPFGRYLADAGKGLAELGFS